jgi:hypothetical protein
MKTTTSGTHDHTPSFLGGGDEEDRSSRPAHTKKLVRPYLNQ